MITFDTPRPASSFRSGDEAERDRALLIKNTGRMALWAIYPEKQAIALYRVIANSLGGWAEHRWSPLARWDADGRVLIYVTHDGEMS